MNKSILVLALVAALGVFESGAYAQKAKSTTPAASAMKCPFDINGNPNYADQVAAAVKAAPNCKAGTAIADACAIGSNIDSQYVGEAYSKCEAEAKLTPAQKTQLGQAKKACDYKYAHAQGSIAVSQHGYCYLDAIKKYVK